MYVEKVLSEALSQIKTEEMPNFLFFELIATSINILVSGRFFSSLRP